MNRLDVATRVTIGFLAVVVVVGVVAVPTLISTRAATIEVGQVSDVAACLNRYEGRIEVARTRAIAALADMDVALLGGIEGLITADPAAMDAALVTADTATAQLEAAIDGIEAATAAYEVAAEHASTDPTRFVDTCQEAP